MPSRETDQSSANHVHLRSLGRAAAIVALCAITAGCVGERATLSAPQPEGLVGGPVDDPVVDGILTALEGRVARHTVKYSITTKQGGQVADVVVFRDTDRQSITSGGVRFIADLDGEQACVLATGTCSAGFESRALPGAPSVQPRFSSSGMAQRLRLAFARRSGPPIASSAEVLGQTVKCVRVPLGATLTVESGELFCVFAQGSLAAFDGADIKIDATDIQDFLDEAAFQTEG